MDIDRLLSKNEQLFKSVHIFREDFGIPPSRKHIGMVIDHVDLDEMRRDFVRELANTVTTFVYSAARQKELVDTLSPGRDLSAAFNELRNRARDKFRPSSLRGQFSELLLFNVLQHSFHAAPLLRKMKLTTNPDLERNGADAIHIAFSGTRPILYVGEAKTVWPKREPFKTAVVAALEDVMVHCSGLRDELNLYVYEEFLPPELEAVAQQYVSGALKEVEVHPVCICSYESPAISGPTRDEILQAKRDALRADCSSMAQHPVFARVSTPLLQRATYILFPVSELESLVASLRAEIGIKDKK